MKKYLILLISVLLVIPSIVLAYPPTAPQIAGSGYTNLTSFVNQTAWRVFYSDTNGDVTELALGADGTYLKSNGAAVAPTFATPAGSGTMTTIKENDIGVGDADIVILDFLGADFDLAETPDTEVQVIINAAIARVADVDMEMLNDVDNEGNAGWILKDDGDGSYSFTNELSVKISVITNIKSANYTIGTDDPKESYGGVIYVTGACTITAEAVATGMSWTLITVGAFAVSQDVNASDKMCLDGVWLDDADKATNTSTTGDSIVCTYYSADGIYCMSGSPDGDHWTDTGD